MGAQVAGYEGVDKRLDVFSQVIKSGGTISDLAAFEQAYAPPYSSAKDPVNIAGFVAENILRNKMQVFYWNETGNINANDLLIDVRTADEHKHGSIGAALNIPLDELRQRIDELPKDRKVYVYCEVGQRGYLAQRILLQNGYANVLNLSGGYRLWMSGVNAQAGHYQLHDAARDPSLLSK